MRPSHNQCDGDRFLPPKSALTAPERARVEGGVDAVAPVPVDVRGRPDASPLGDCSNAHGRSMRCDAVKQQSHYKRDTCEGERLSEVYAQRRGVEGGVDTVAPVLVDVRGRPDASPIGDCSCNTRQVNAMRCRVQGSRGVWRATGASARGRHQAKSMCKDSEWRVVSTLLRQHLPWASAATPMPLYQATTPQKRARASTRTHITKVLRNVCEQDSHITRGDVCLVIARQQNIHSSGVKQQSPQTLKPTRSQ